VALDRVPRTLRLAIAMVVAALVASVLVGLTLRPGGTPGSSATPSPSASMGVANPTAAVAVLQILAFSRAIEGQLQGVRGR
jgi:hypothetical protein